MDHDGAGWLCLAMMSKGAAVVFLGVRRGIEQRLVCVERNRSFSRHSGEDDRVGCSSEYGPALSLMAVCTTQCRCAAYVVDRTDYVQSVIDLGRKSHTARPGRT